MIGRPKVPLVLTTPEQQALDSLAHRARTAPQVARRARIVLACARGLDNQTVAKNPGALQSTQTSLTEAKRYLHGVRRPLRLSHGSGRNPAGLVQQHSS